MCLTITQRSCSMMPDDGIGTKKKKRESLQWKRRNFVGKRSNENTFANGFTKCSIIFILESTV